MSLFDCFPKLHHGDIINHLVFLNTIEYLDQLLFLTNVWESKAIDFQHFRSTQRRDIYKVTIV